MLGISGYFCRGESCALPGFREPSWRYLHGPAQDRSLQDWVDMRYQIALGFTALTMLIGTGSAIAQEAAGTPTVKLVSPKLCTVAPRTIESLNAIVEALPSDGTDVRVPVRFGPGEGDPAD